MSAYVITGVSKGIGFGFVKNISQDPANLVVGLIRDKAGTEKKVAEELGNRPNVHILHRDLTNYADLKQAAADTAKIVGGRGIDYLVAKGAFSSQFDAYSPIGAFGHGDLDWINNNEIEVASLAAALSAALNVIVTKFSAQYKKDGVLFFSTRPGAVEVSHYDNPTPEQIQGLTGFLANTQVHTPLQGSSTCRRSHCNCPIAVGEGQHRD
ncbi:short chain dehydrogenase (AtsC), putative [Talaromyces islandicus]|uniref:Short chain dehydrogenase (AtsC), putative n=1 Tax=Talaromyces islandicus TaxID=28573 RepID=A0A0U1LMD6_TALIS|nr:short chain dehydrogenase (AtsC), putative [Talaromyces islandicus]